LYIATNTQIQSTINLLERRPKKVIDKFLNKMIFARNAGQSIYDQITQEDLLELKEAREALNLLESTRSKYSLSY
jgi:hypothetical protein